MKNNVIQSYRQNVIQRLKPLFDYHRHTKVIINDGFILSQPVRRTRFLPKLGDTAVELYENKVLYCDSNSALQSIPLEHLLDAEDDYMFNMYLIMDEKLFSTLIYIQYEHEYYNIWPNHEIYCTSHILKYIKECQV